MGQLDDGLDGLNTSKHSLMSRSVSGPHAQLSLPSLHHVFSSSSFHHALQKESRQERSLTLAL